MSETTPKPEDKTGTNNAFTITMQPPIPFQWEAIQREISQQLRQDFSNDDITQLTHQYAALLRIKSWEYGIDWSVFNNRVTLSVPNRVSALSRFDKQSKRQLDGLSVLLKDVIEEIPVSLVLKHFHTYQKSK